MSSTSAFGVGLQERRANVDLLSFLETGDDSPLSQTQRNERRNDMLLEGGLVLGAALTSRLASSQRLTADEFNAAIRPRESLPVARIDLAGGDAARGVPPAVHKNSLDFVGETHVYAIRGPVGTHKIGESAQGLRVRDGASIRAEKQVRQLQRTTGQAFESRILRSFDSKAAARDYETRLIERFRGIYGNDALPGNLTNR